MDVSPTNTAPCLSMANKIKLKNEIIEIYVLSLCAIYTFNSSM